MEMTVIGVILIMVALFLTYLAGGIKAEIKDHRRRIKKLEDSANNDGRVKNPHLTNAGIEDAIAVLLDVLQNREVEDLRLKRASEILRQIRSNPGAYNEDRPNGKRNWMGR